MSKRSFKASASSVTPRIPEDRGIDRRERPECHAEDYGDFPAEMSEPKLLKIPVEVLQQNTLLQTY